MEKLKSVQRKEVKALEGERRGAVKKTKATAGKGKKGKEAVAATEAEYDAKAKKMADRHTADIAAFDQGAEEGAAADSNDDEEGRHRAARCIGSQNL